MTRPRLLDLFCCEGGAAKGYMHAGFEVVGVDLKDYSKRIQEQLLGIDWMTQHGLYQSLPPIYTAWLGKQLMEAVA